MPSVNNKIRNIWFILEDSCDQSSKIKLERFNTIEYDIERTYFINVNTSII